MNTYQAGIDIGSTTVKLVVLDENGQMIFGRVPPPSARTHSGRWPTAAGSARRPWRVRAEVRPPAPARSTWPRRWHPLCAGGRRGGAGAGARAPQTDVAIELGGEDAKIIYFTGGLEERMNGVCAGGTGSFIDQMAALLQTDAPGLDDEAAHYQELYPIAARCGVFAKTDIQPLINEGATRADLAASIFQAVVNQTISGPCLRQAHPRRMWRSLGGPLHFLSELRQAFIRTLKLTEENAIDPENSHLFAATGAAMAALRTARTQPSDGC